MNNHPPLTSQELQRYARHLTLREFGVNGQARLKQARVLLVGAGGLGSPAALYLAAAGVGSIGIVDHDVVDVSNLQRQVLHSSDDIGIAKVDSAAAHIAALNPHVQVETHQVALSSNNARQIIAEYDVVVDGSDNFPTRYLVNDACVLEKRPLVFGSVLRFEGQLSLFAMPGGPCYRCLFREPPPPDLVPNCADAGVIGALPGIIGTAQALETIKHVARLGRSLMGRLLLFDGLSFTWREIAVRRDSECAICGDHPTIRELVDYDAFCGITPMRSLADAAEVAPRDVSVAMASGSPPFLLDVRESWEYDLVHIAASRNIPLGALPARLAELPRGVHVVALCHHGARSLVARDLLIRAGFAGVQSMAGGIDRWAVELDPAMRRY